MDEDVNVFKYAMRFSIAYFLLLLLLAVILTLLNIDGNTGGSIGALLGAVAIVVHKFVDDNERAPNKTEKRKLVWLSYFLSLLVSGLLFSLVILLLEGTSGFVFLASIFSQLGSLITIGIIIFVSFIYLMALSFGYGSLAKIHIKALQKKGRIQ